MQKKIKKIGFIGLGAMGTPMTSFLLKAGYEVKGFDVDKKRVSGLTRLGLIPAKSPADAGKERDLIMLSLPKWAVVQEVVEGRDGLLEILRKGQIVLDTSTVSPSATRAMARRLAKKGVHWMDTPVSGAANQARLGNMVFMVGGKKTLFSRVKAVLDQVGKKTVYVGKNGDAAMLKLVVNHVLFLNQAAAIEGMTLGLKAGLNPDVMRETLVSGAAASDVIAARGKDMLAGSFKPKGALWIGLKDLDLAMEAGKELGVMLPMGGLYREMMFGAAHRGWVKEDATVVMRLYEEMAGGLKAKPGKK